LRFKEFCKISDKPIFQIFYIEAEVAETLAFSEQLKNLQICCEFFWDVLFGI